jgi:ElaA protein
MQEKFKDKKIKISAQAHLSGFYQKHGFKPKGKEYLEDGIPHVAMYKN